MANYFSGMSPICDTSWTRETLRKNKVVRTSTDTSDSRASTPSPPIDLPDFTVSMSPEGSLSRSRAPSPLPPFTPVAKRKHEKSPSKMDPRTLERGVDIPSSPLPLPRKRKTFSVILNTFASECFLLKKKNNEQFYLESSSNL